MALPRDPRSLHMAVFPYESDNLRFPLDTMGVRRTKMMFRGSCCPERPSCRQNNVNISRVVGYQRVWRTGWR